MHYAFVYFSKFTSAEVQILIIKVKNRIKNSQMELLTGKAFWSVYDSFFKHPFIISLKVLIQNRLKFAKKKFFFSKENWNKKSHYSSPWTAKKIEIKRKKCNGTCQCSHVHKIFPLLKLDLLTIQKSEMLMWNQNTCIVHKGEFVYASFLISSNLYKPT